MHNKSVTKIGICRRQRDAPEESLGHKYRGLDSLRGLCFGWGGKFYLLLEGFGESPEGFGFLWSCFLKD